MTDPDPTLEQAVIGAALTSSMALTDTAKALTEADFHNPVNGIIWDHIITLHDAGTPVDAHTVTAALQRSGVLKRVGGPLYIADCITEGINPAAAPHHARIIRETATLRRLTAAGQRIQQLAQDGETSPEAITVASVAELEAAYRPTDQQEHTKVGDLVYDVIEDLDRQDTPPGIHWPYREAERILHPMTPGRLVIVAARPGVGKSVTCVDVARHAAMHQGKTVVLHCLEMERGEVVLRILAAEARVSMSHLQDRALTEDDWDRVQKAAASLQDADLHILDNPSVGLADIKASIKQYQPDIVIVDYVQIATMNPKIQSRREQIEEFTRGLKLTAKAAGIPILVAAQVKRPSSDARVQDPPLSTDLRESGGLEADADCVVLLHRPDTGDPENARAGEIDFITAKQRNGPTGVTTLVHQMHYSRIVDPAYA